MLYIQLKSKATLQGDVYIKHVAALHADNPANAGIAGEIKLFSVGSCAALVRAVDIARLVSAKLPGEQLMFTGATDCCVTPPQRAQKKLWIAVKAAVIIVFLFIGGMTTIINFQTDADIEKAHEGVYTLVTGREQTHPLIVSIPYAIGVGIGVLIFCNVLPGSKKSPTLVDLQDAKFDDEIALYHRGESES